MNGFLSYNSKSNYNKLKNIVFVFFIAIGITACTNKKNVATKQLPIAKPIQLHPDNQHYFLYKGKPLAIVSSGEHYGALVNLDFDYNNYLKTLSAEGMNYTRILTGSYFEEAGDYFGIQHNTLGPETEKVITPWAKVKPDTTSVFKYDLTVWNDPYFRRLRDFMKVAANHDIIVEVTLFSSYYGDQQWKINPLNPINNINLSKEISYTEIQTIKDALLFKFQESYVRKMVKELNEYDNFFFEIQNEPWADHLDTIHNSVNREKLNVENAKLKASFANKESLQWQKRIASIISDEEKNLPKRHLIAQNYADSKNYDGKLEVNSVLRQERKDLMPFLKSSIPVVDDDISIIMFHYAGSETVEWNHHYNKVIGFDESGFAGTEDFTYRKQAWRFMLSGGGLFNNLDYSFFVGHEDGLGKNKAPGGGSKALRQQLKILSDFLHSFELPKLHPNQSCVIGSPNLIPYILSDKDNAYAVFLEAIGTKSSFIQLKTGNGNYQVQTLNTITGLFSEPVAVKAIDNVLKITIDIPEGELVLKIIKE